MSEAFVVFGVRGHCASDVSQTKNKKLKHPVTLIDDETLASFNLRKYRLFCQTFPFQFIVYGVYFTTNELYMIQDHLQQWRRTSENDTETENSNSNSNSNLLTNKLEQMLLNLNAFATHFGFTTTPNFHIGVKGQMITDLFISTQSVFDEIDNDNNANTPQNTPEPIKFKNKKTVQIVSMKTTVVRFRMIQTNSKTDPSQPPNAPMKIRRKLPNKYLVVTRRSFNTQNTRRKLSFNNL